MTALAGSFDYRKISFIAVIHRVFSIKFIIINLQ